MAEQKSHVWVAFFIFAAAFLWLAPAAHTQETGAVGWVTSLSGRVSYTSQAQGPSAALNVGQEIFNGMTITTEKNSAVRILFKGGVLLIVGEKERPDVSKRGPASFHLVERDFGRFARAVKINAAIDGAGARARLSNGELRVVLPRIADRRGAGQLVPIDTPSRG